MSEYFVTVCERDDETRVELPLEDDQTLSLSTLRAQFPTCTGLKYKSESGCFRGLRLVNDRVYPPNDCGWGRTVFYCVFPKDDSNVKRKCEPTTDSASKKLRRMDCKKCTDLIVLNLAWQTDEDKLREYFSQFGDVAMVQIKRDHGTQRSRGYAFIRFCNYTGQAVCLAERHVIDNRSCEVRIPNSKTEGDRQEIGRKIHVGRITEDVTDDVLRTFFAQYGRVVDVFIPKPFRNFAFVTFEDFDVAASLVGTDVEINGCQATISSAAPKLPPGARTKMATNSSNQVAVGARQMTVADPWAAWAYNSQSFGYGGPNGFGDAGYAQQQQQQAQQQHYQQQHLNAPDNSQSVGFPMGMHPAAAAAAAALAAQYTRAHQRQNISADRAHHHQHQQAQQQQQPIGGAAPPSAVENNAIAAFATLNILNNPNVVAAIVNAATNAGQRSPTGTTGVAATLGGQLTSATANSSSALLSGQQPTAYADGCR